MSQKWTIRLAAVVAVLAFSAPSAQSQIIFFRPGFYPSFPFYPGGYPGMNYGGFYGPGYSSMSYGGWYNYSYSYSTTTVITPGFAASSSDRNRVRTNMAPAAAVPSDSHLLQAAWAELTGDSRAVVVVLVPDDNTQISVQGMPMSLTGAIRRYVTPPLNSNEGYDYNIRAQWTDANGRQDETQTVARACRGSGECRIHGKRSAIMVNPARRLATSNYKELFETIFMSEELDRWQMLAEELGLPPEPKKSGAIAPPVRVVEQVVEQVFEESPPTREEVAPPEPEPFESQPASESVAEESLQHIVPMEEPVELPPITSLDFESMIEGQSPEGMPVQEESVISEQPERPRGRGRRGQRGRRGRGERSEPSPVAAEASEEAPREERSRKRGGRGRRPEPKPVPEPEPEETLTEEEPIESFEDDFDDGPEDNLADLNVPSWSDLIASLYRPDR